MRASPNDLARKVAAEGVGTAFLVAAVIGSGVMATNLTRDHGLRLLINSVVTGAALVALVLALQPVSAAFNPVVTAVEALLGRITWREAGFFSVAQVGGGVLGAVVANLMFNLDAVTLSTHERSGTGPWIGEIVATLGLVLVVFGSIGTGLAAVMVRVRSLPGGPRTGRYRSRERALRMSPHPDRAVPLSPGRGG